MSPPTPNLYPMESTLATVTQDAAKAAYRRLLRAEAEAVIGRIHTMLAEADNYNVEAQKKNDPIGHASYDRVLAHHLVGVYTSEIHQRTMAIRDLMGAELDLHGYAYDPTPIHTLDSNESTASIKGILFGMADILVKMAALLV